jgi:hypothetical protein
VPGFVQVHVVANRQCLMKFLAPVDPSIEYTTNKCFRLTATRSRWALKGLFQEKRMVRNIYVGWIGLVYCMEDRLVKVNYFKNPVVFNYQIALFGIGIGYLL